MDSKLGTGDNRKIFVTADHHFGHAKIIDYERRPFQSVDEMNIVLIQRWNQVVKPNDIVIELGDFSFLNFNKTKDILDKLHGTKVLILGNHDMRRTATWWERAGFKYVYKQIELANCLMTHIPKANPNEIKGINICGHIHSQLQLLPEPTDKYLCVSVENWNFYPIELEVALTPILPQ